MRPLLLGILFLSALVAQGHRAAHVHAQPVSKLVWAFPFLSAVQEEKANEILANRKCPCGCGNYLPGSANAPACFGCSVGKTEISKVIADIAEGRSPGDIMLDLGDPVLVDVFADYTNENLRDVWEMAQEAAASLGQRRVVLRAIGRTEEARNAIRLAECARRQGKFFEMQEALINHRGPWNTDALILIGAEMGFDADDVRNCFKRENIDQQIAKDKEHARTFGIRGFPAVAVNREVVVTTPEAIRRAIREVLEDDSI